MHEQQWDMDIAAATEAVAAAVVPPRSDGERTLVLPGEEIDVHGLQPGPGTYRVDGRTYASVLGLLSRRPPVVRVIPLSGRYIPKPQDVVVGTVTDVQTTFWLLDIGAPRWAPLHMTGTPWKIEVGECGQYLHVGDTVVVAIENIDPTGRIGVTMLGDDLGKVDGGTVITVSPAKVPRVIGRSGSMIQMLTAETGCRIAVGQNGRIWVDGTPEGMHPGSGGAPPHRGGGPALRADRAGRRLPRVDARGDGRDAPDADADPTPVRAPQPDRRRGRARRRRLGRPGPVLEIPFHTEKPPWEA